MRACTQGAPQARRTAVDRSVDIVRGTGEEQVEEDGELVDGVSDDVPHHDRRDDVLAASVRLATQKVVGRQLSGQRQRRQRVLQQVHPDHLHRFDRRTLLHNNNNNNALRFHAKKRSTYFQ